MGHVCLYALGVICLLESGHYSLARVCVWCRSDSNGHQTMISVNSLQIIGSLSLDMDYCGLICITLAQIVFLPVHLCWDLSFVAAALSSRCPFWRINSTMARRVCRGRCTAPLTPVFFYKRPILIHSSAMPLRSTLFVALLCVRVHGKAR